MSIWFFIWLGLSGALLYFLGWTLYILFRQKRAWKAYALKMKLRYDPKQFVESAEISGLLYGYTTSMFAGEHMTPDQRGTRKLTALEIHLTTRAPFEAAVASGGMVNIARNLGLKEEMRPAHPDWQDSWIATAHEIPVLEAYLTPERVTAIAGLMKMKNAWVILIFRGEVALLRVDTPDPLDKVEKIDKIFRKLTEAAKILELKSGEEKRLKAVAALKPQRGGTVKVAPAAEEISLSLEEDAPAPVAKPEDSAE